MRTALFAIVGALTAGLTIGCTALLVRDFTGPDGTLWHSTWCNDITQCYRRAGDRCPQGYDMKDISDSARIASVGTQQTQNGSSATVRQTTTLTIMFSCR